MLDPEWSPDDTESERAQRTRQEKAFRERNSGDDTVQVNNNVDNSSTITTETQSQQPLSSNDDLSQGSLFRGNDDDIISMQQPPSFFNIPPDPTFVSERERKEDTKEPTILRRSDRNKTPEKLIWYKEDEAPDFDYNPNAFYTKKIRTGLLNNCFLSALD